MQSNMSFTAIGFKGGAAVNGIPVVAQGTAPKSIGGNFSTSSSNDGKQAYFGYVMSALLEAPTDFLAGIPTDAIVRGIVQVDPSILQNDPAKPDFYLKGSPMTVIFEGSVRFNSWLKNAAGAEDPTIGSLIIFKNTTGEIQFIPDDGTAVPSGWTQLENSRVVETDPSGQNGIVIDFKLNDLVAIT